MASKHNSSKSYIFIIVLEILLLRLKHDPNLKFLKFEVEDHSAYDKVNLEVEPIKSFADDMTAVM